MHSYSCFKKAAELGSVNSMIETAQMIDNRIGVEQKKTDENDPERSAVESKYKKTEEKSRIINIRVLLDHITLENIENNLNLPFHYEVNQIKQDENSFELKFNSQKEKSKSIKEIKKNKKIDICDHENKSSLFDLLNLSLPLLDGDEYYQGKDNFNYIKIRQTGYFETYKVYQKRTHKIYIAKVFRLENEYNPILCDFGNSKTMQNDSSLFDNESSVYKAPELFITNPVYSEKTDVYSFGIIMYMILNEEFHKSRYKSNFCVPELLKLKMSNNYPDIPKNIPSIYADLIKRCCDVSIDSRPDFQIISNILIFANYSYT